MKRVPLLASLIAVTSFFIASSAYSAVYTHTIAPEQIALSGTSSILVGGNTGGDSLPVGHGDSPLGWEDGSFYTNIDGGTNRYSQLYVNLQVALNSTSPIMLSDLKSITYHTRETTLNSMDWALRIYTKPNPANGDLSWYGYRFDGKNAPASDTAWNLWDADSAGWFVGVSDRTAGQNVYTPIEDSLTELKANYSGELLYFSLFSGASANTGALLNGLDGIVITMANDDQIRLNLVPEPGTITLAVLGCIALVAHLRSRKKISSLAA